MSDMPTAMKSCTHCNAWSVPAGRCRHGDLCYRCAMDLDEWTFGQIEHPEGKETMMRSVWPKRAGEDTVELGGVDLCAILGHDPYWDEPNHCGRCDGVITPE